MVDDLCALGLNLAEGFYMERDNRCGVFPLSPPQPVHCHPEWGEDSKVLAVNQWGVVW